MKLLIVLLAILLATVSITLVALKDPGYVVIGYAHTTVEMSLVMLLLLTLFLFVICYYLIRTYFSVKQFYPNSLVWIKNKKEKKSHQLLIKGLIQIEEGSKQEAETNLIKSCHYGDLPFLHYVSAARAAHEQGYHDKSEQFLGLALEVMPSARLAIFLIQTSYRYESDRIEDAMVSSEELKKIAPKNSEVNRLLLKLYKRQKDWEALLSILPLVRKNKIMDLKTSEQLEVDCYAELLIATCSNAKGIKNVEDVWLKTPKSMRLQHKVITNYTKALLHIGKSHLAEVHIRNYLRRLWCEELVKLYGTIEAKDINQQLIYAEGWLMVHQKDPALLLTLGRICIKAQLWGKARQYIESSVGLQESAETYQVLGHLLESLGDKNTALNCYRKGLEVTTDKILSKLEHLPNIEQHKKFSQQKLIA